MVSASHSAPMLSLALRSDCTDTRDASPQFSPLQVIVNALLAAPSRSSPSFHRNDRYQRPGDSVSP